MVQTDHEQIVIEIDGKPVEVDKGIERLIIALNKLGLKTEFSCIGGGNGDNVSPYVIFSNDVSDEKILRLICTKTNFPGSFYKWYRWMGSTNPKKEYLAATWMFEVSSFEHIELCALLFELRAKSMEEGEHEVDS